MRTYPPQYRHQPLRIYGKLILKFGNGMDKKTKSYIYISEIKEQTLLY
jgi:hypothetical protein